MEEINEQEAVIADVDAVDYREGRLRYFPDVPFRVNVHSNTTEIIRKAFYRCTTLTDIRLHENVTQISPSAFDGCINLQRGELPAGLLRLERNSFRGCTSLHEIMIPATVLYIGDYAYANCKSLHTVVFAPRTTNIELGQGIFGNCTDLRLVTLPQNLQFIPVCFFNNCTSLIRLQIPVSVTQFGEGALYGTGISSMKYSELGDFIPGTIMLPPKLQSISEECFCNCKSLTHIRIPLSVKWIGGDALSGSGLRSIRISKYVLQIGSGAWQNCSSLKSVTFHSSNNLNIANNIFVNCPLLSVIVMHPWLWPKLFISMNEHPDFIFKFFREYHQTHIFDFETPVVRPLQRSRKRKYLDFATEDVRSLQRLRIR